MKNLAKRGEALTRHAEKEEQVVFHPLPARHRGQMAGGDKMASARNT
jgi:hypothetical protein